MFWIGTNLANWKEGAEKFIMHQQTYLDALVKIPASKFVSFPGFPEEVNLSWDILCIQAKNNWWVISHVLVGRFIRLYELFCLLSTETYLLFSNI